MHLSEPVRLDLVTLSEISDRLKQEGIPESELDLKTMLEVQDEGFKKLRFYDPEEDTSPSEELEPDYEDSQEDDILLIVY